MAKKFEDVWEDVEEVLQNAKGIAFEGCHKIYILMDDEQMEQMKGYGYGEEGSFLISSGEQNEREMLATLKDWFKQSCPLRFIESVATTEDEEDSGFRGIIPQGYEGEFCSSCGDYGAEYDGYCDECREDWEEEDTWEDEEEDEEEDV